tara:strand:+ start:409 stop:579 length:171 start_codon:yes stop_codon:yes gene_type:complete
MSLDSKAILSYEAHRVKVSIEKPTSILTIDDFMEMVRSLALAAGYNPDNVNAYFED